MKNALLTSLSIDFLSIVHMYVRHDIGLFPFNSTVPMPFDDLLVMIPQYQAHVYVSYCLKDGIEREISHELH